MARRTTRAIKCDAVLDWIEHRRRAALEIDPAGYPGDIVGYARDVLGVTLTPSQREVCERLLEPPYKVLVPSGHNTGKSFLGGVLASWHYDQFDPGLTYCTAPTARSLRDILFREIRARRPTDPDWLPKDNRCESSPEHWIGGYVAKSGEAFQGRHMAHLMLIFDEAVGIGEELFRVGRSMVTGSPGHYWVCFYNPTDVGSAVYHEEQSGEWAVVRMSQFDHPNVEAELAGSDPPYPDAVRLTQVVRDMDDYGRRSAPEDPESPDEVRLGDLRWVPGPNADCRVLGRWPRTGGETVWSEALWDKVLACREDLNPNWKVQIGCDVARFGLDETAIFVRQGPCFLRHERHSGWGLDRTVERLRQLAHEYHGPHEPRQVPIIVDAAGLGAGVVDFAGGYNVIADVGASAAIDDRRYYNHRCELWFNAVEHAKSGLIDVSRLDPRDLSRLRAELLTPKYWVDPKNRFVVESKDDTKERLKRSPDMADGFNLTCWWVH